MNRIWTKIMLATLGLTAAACGAESMPNGDDSVEDIIENENAAETSDALCSPSVSYVTPIGAKLNQKTTFYVVGSCLPSTTAFWVDQCANVSKIGWSTTQVAFTCTPSYSTGDKAGVVKDQTGGITLKNFTVSVK